MSAIKSPNELQRPRGQAWRGAWGQGFHVSLDGPAGVCRDHKGRAGLRKDCSCGSQGLEAPGASVRACARACVRAGRGRHGAGTARSGDASRAPDPRSRTAAGRHVEEHWREAPPAGDRQETLLILLRGYLAFETWFPWSFGFPGKYVEDARVSPFPRVGGTGVCLFGLYVELEMLEVVERSGQERECVVTSKKVAICSRSPDLSFSA